MLCRFLLSLVVSWLKEELADSDLILLPGLDTLDSQTLFLDTIDADMLMCRFLLSLVVPWLTRTSSWSPAWTRWTVRPSSWAL